jgi:hypothetical protein
MRAFAMMMGAAALLTGCSGGQGNEAAAPANETNGTEVANLSTAVPAPAPAAEPANEASALPAAAADPGWAGTYQGKAEGNNAEGTLKIRPASRGRINVAVDIGAPGCAGDVTFRNVTAPQGDTLVLSRPEGEDGQCHLTLKRGGKSIAIHEENCTNYHGFECSFEGTMSR